MKTTIIAVPDTVTAPIPAALRVGIADAYNSAVAAEYAALPPAQQASYTPPTVQAYVLARVADMFRSFNTDGTARWLINSSGNFITGLDNASVSAPAISLSTAGAPAGDESLHRADPRAHSSAHGVSNTRITGQNGATGILTLFNGATSDFDRLQFGGTTNAFPAIKRSGSDVEIVKADNTAADTAIILSSPDGNRWRVTVTNAGALLATDLP